MSGAHQYHSPDPVSPTDNSSDDDLELDLNELDPVRGGNTRLDTVRSNLRRLRAGGVGTFARDIALTDLRPSKPRGRKWGGPLANGKGDDEDLEELLEDRELEEGRSRRPPNGKLPGAKRQGQTSRMASFRQSIQLPEALRSDFHEGKASIQESNQESRDILVGRTQLRKYPANIVSNAKYTAWSFLPRTLWNEFSFFLNIYFLLVALSQIIPYLRIGYMSTYIAPLAFVLTISIGKEAFDDIGRRRRDAEANSEPYTVISLGSSANTNSKKQRSTQKASQETGALKGTFEIQKRSRDIHVGDILKLVRNQRLPADVILLKSIPNESVVLGVKEDVLPLRSQTQSPLDDQTSSKAAPLASDPSADPPSNPLNESAPSDDTSSETFIRTDQLDGETDWKLRLPSPLTQSLDATDFARLKIKAGAPDKKVNEFVGTIEITSKEASGYDPYIAPETGSTQAGIVEQDIQSLALTIDNTAWANTVLASNTTTLACVIYTGRQTRSAMSTSASRSKTGLLELEINNLTKILCALTLTLSLVLVALEGFEPTNKKPWYVAIMIYLILFSTIIPISLRVNLDMAKTVYARFIERDTGIPGTVVRTSTIPEDLGRIEYLLTDKTGTLTQNEMDLRKIHVGTVSYANEAMEEVASYVKQAFSPQTASDALFTPSSGLAIQAASTTRTRREIGSRVRDLILALALCHNVTPTTDLVDGKTVTAYQASSPDEIAIVQYTEHVGLRLAHRDRKSITLQDTHTSRIAVRVRILEVFPFTSDSKRMGILVQFCSQTGSQTGSPSYESDVWFYQKGADTVMTPIVAANDWLDEETANMAREGLRTLVIGRKRLSQTQYTSFAQAYKTASLSLLNRDSALAGVSATHLEHSLEVLGVTGVEDKLQPNVRPSLELLRNAGVKTWMLTGDKPETARCVALNSKLIPRNAPIHTLTNLLSATEASRALTHLTTNPDTTLLVDGPSLTTLLTHLPTAFIGATIPLPALIACRCSPAQKADLALLLRRTTGKRIACIGDGGNDVSMIQAADVGIGIVGKEGHQASLAADFSVTQFSHLTKLLVWHGRNSYRRSAKLAQFVIHRGLIIAVCQTMFSIAGHFDPKGLFVDWLLVGYATVYTMAPVFSLVLDRDVDEDLANLYPELYLELKTGKVLSYRSFFGWVLVSVYQGAVIQGLSQLLLRSISGPRLVSLAFTVLVLNELVMVAVSVTTWHWVMVVCILGTTGVYAASVPFLGRYFDLLFVGSWGFWWRVAAVGGVSLVPVWGGKVVGRVWRPESYRKVRG